MTFPRGISPAFAAALLLALAACGSSDVKETLGLNREAPDEFRVISRPPLSVPPQFNLRPPSLTDESPAQMPSHKQAESLMLGTQPSQPDHFVLQPGTAETAVVPVTTSGGVSGSSAAETQFLQNAGAAKSDPNVRTELMEERVQRQQEKEESSWWDIMSTTPSKKDPMVDAKKEAERIKQNKEAGKPVTEGETPEVKGRDRGILGELLGY